MTKKVKTICKKCNKSFMRREADKILYCSKACQFDYRKHERVCINLNCKKLFYPTQPYNKLCSRYCASIYNSFEYKAQYGVGGRQGGLHRLRFEVFKRDNFSCTYCGRNVKDDKIKIHCDHINPKSKGGLDLLSNLTTSCEQCNLGKKDILL